jgi:hypothetical protein
MKISSPRSGSPLGKPLVFSVFAQSREKAHSTNRLSPRKNIGITVGAMGGLTLAVIATALPASAQTTLNGLGIYNAPSTATDVVSQQYTIRIKPSNTTTWRPASVLWSNLKSSYVGNNVYSEDERYYNSIFGCSQSYVNFEMSQSVDVEVSRIGGFILENTKIYPANKVTNVRFFGDKLYFTMPRPCNVAVDINGEMESRTHSSNGGPSQQVVHSLSIHGNPVLEGKPTQNDPSVSYVDPLPANPTQAQWQAFKAQLANFKNSPTLKTMYFKPGAHNIGLDFTVYSNKNYYIPGDAIIYGTFNNIENPPMYVPAQNIRIFGHGTISGNKFVHWELAKVDLNKDYSGVQNRPVTPVTVTQADKNANNIAYKEQQRIEFKSRPIDLTKCKNVKIQGITIADPAYHAMHLYDDGVERDNFTEISWVKVFGWRANSDGGSTTNNSRIFNCFYRIQDDGYYPLGIALSDNVLWSDANGASLRLDLTQDLQDNKLLSIFKTDTFRAESNEIIFRRNLWWSDSGSIELPQNQTAGDTVFRDKKFVFSNINISDASPSKPPILIRQGATGSFTNTRFENVNIEAMPSVVINGRENAKNIIYSEGGTVDVKFHNLVIRGEVVTGNNNTNYFATEKLGDGTVKYTNGRLKGNSEYKLSTGIVNVKFSNSLLPRTGWSAISGSLTALFTDAFYAIDGDNNTRWSTVNMPQTPGQYFQVDMKSLKTFDRVMLNTVASNNDYPRGYRVLVSSDATTWREVATGSGAGAVTMIPFLPQTARHIRVEQTGSASWNWWSIFEFNVFESDAFDRTGWTATGQVGGATSGSAAAIDGRADTRWSTQSFQGTTQQYFTVDMKSPKTFDRISMDSSNSPGDFSRKYEVYVSNDGVSWGSSVAVGDGYTGLTSITFSQQTARYIRISQTGSSPDKWWSIHEFNVYKPR